MKLEAKVEKPLGVGIAVPDRYQLFWQEFAGTRRVDPTPRFLEAFHFDDNAPSANELGSLVLSGQKRATAALLWAHDAESKPLPAPGNLSIVTSFEGEPLCVIETQRVDIVPFNEVTEEFAASEGEGDGTLAFRRRAHEAFFGRECQHIGREPSPGVSRRRPMSRSAAPAPRVVWTASCAGWTRLRSMN